MAKKAVAKKVPIPPQSTLTARQREIYEFLREKIVSRGYGPTVREIALHFGIQSPNGVTCHLKALEKKGLISREAFISRSIQLTEPPSPQAALPLAGQLIAGQPLEMIPEPQTRLEFAGLFASAAHCCLRVSGHGLQDDAMITEGDYVVVRRQPDCRDGDLVLAIVDDSQAAVKRFYRESQRVRLESINRSKPPVFAKRVTIVGLVIGVIRQY
jgi:repressor LexA